MSRIPTIWIPIEDGGRAELPMTDPRAVQYLAERGHGINRPVAPKPIANAKQASDFLKSEQARTALLRQMRQELEQEEAELQIIQNIISRSNVSGWWVNDETFSHDRDVVTVINYALHWGRQAASHSEQVEIAREKITQLREKSNSNAENLILRDAERYLWGRVGIPVFSKEYGSLPTQAGAPFANGVYQFYKAIAMGANSVFGTDYVKSNPNRPFSPLGGGFWYQLGLSNYYTHDRGNADNRSSKSPARELTVGDVIARRGVSPADAAEVDTGKSSIDY